MLLLTFNIFEIFCLLPKTIPILHPDILNVLLKEFNSKQCSFAPFKFKILIGLSFKIKLYGLSFTNKISCFLAKLTNSSSKLRSQLAPVGM